MAKAMDDTDTNRDVQKTIEAGVTAWKRDDYERALQHFREALSLEPDFPDVRNKAGLCLAMMGELEEALGELDEAVQLAPTYSEAHLNRAIVLNSLGRFEEAEEAFRRAGELERRDRGPIPSDVGNRIAITHSRLGELYLVAEEPEWAVGQFERALDVRPDFLDIRANLAEALMEVGELERARGELEDVLDRNPGFTEARLRLGVIHKRQGRIDEAVREWERCLEDDPRDLRARAYIASVRPER